MKKLIVLLSAVALIGLTSCSQEQLGPKEGGLKDQVKTSFSFTVSTNAATKATAATVQDGTTFRGMSDMTLFVANDDLVFPQTQGADFLADFVYDLGTLSNGEISASQSSKIYNLSIPVGVNNMTFYGRATKTGTDAEEGAIAWNVGTTKATTSFGSKAILADESDFTDVSDDLAALLNDVISAEGWATVGDNVMLKPLKDAYKELTTIQTGELRDGSGAGILRTMSDLYKVVSKITTGDGATIAAAIVAKIETYFDVNADGVLTYKTADFAEFPSSLGLPDGSAQLTFANNKFAYVTAPETMGSATVAVPSVQNFVFPAELTYWVNSPIRVTSAEVKDTDYPTTVNAWNAARWTSGGWASGVKNGTVASDTRAVALQDNINYGVALLKTTVQYSGATVADNRKAIVERKAKELDPSSTYTEDDMLITVDGNTFQVKGILVGGQPAQVGWDWTAAAGDFKNVVYDNTFGSNAIPASGKSDPFYTLVFDNLNASTKNVNIALELVNNAKDADGKAIDFYGRDNLIPAGGVFYLVGQLDMDNMLSTTSTVVSLLTTLTDWKLEKKHYPPYNYPEGSDQAALDQLWSDFGRAFMQDFVTTVNFKITNLHGAYSTVPDLRSVEMTFGLSVDLKWEPGVTFDVELK